MNWSPNRAFRKLFRLPPSAAQVARDVDDELNFHFESRVADLVAHGNSESDARSIANREYGDVNESKAELAALDRRIVIRHRRMNMLDVLRQDVLYALRGLRRSPGLTLAIIVTLGLGVGANTAVFTALDRLFFQTPPGVVDATSVRRLYANVVTATAPSLPDGHSRLFRLRDLNDLTAASRGMARVEGYYIGRRGLLMPSKERLMMAFITPGYFSMLGVHAERGRLFAPDENRLIGAAVPVAVISANFWRTHFASDTSIFGKQISVHTTTGSDPDAVYTIVGVAQHDFEGVGLEPIDIWAPLANQEGGLDGVDALDLLARVGPRFDARTFDSALTAQYLTTHAVDNWTREGTWVMSAPLLAARAPAKAGNRIIGFPVRNQQLLMRIAGVGVVVLLISIANVASLLLMRAVKRRREIAVRLALGISRGRLIAQLLIESVILSLVSGGVAVSIAYLTGGYLRSALTQVPWSSTVVDARVALFAMLAAMLSGVLAGLAPIAFAFRADVASFLKTSSSVSQQSSSHIRSTLLVAQASLCMVLIASAGLFVQSLRRAADVDRGFDAERSLEVAVKKTTANPELELKQIVDHIRALPNVVAIGRGAVSIGTVGIYTKVGETYRDTIGAGPRGPALEFVEPEYLRAASIPVIAGRAFTSADNFAFVTILNESLARTLWPKGDVLGRCVHVREPQSPCRTIIGVVRDVIWDVNEPSMFRVYAPLAQAWIMPPSIIPNYLVVRTRATSTAADISLIRKTVESIVSDPSFVSVRRVSNMIEPLLAPWRLAAKLFLTLGILGLLAAGTGMYGIVSYDVTQRSRELGVRVALGATSFNILQLVIKSGAEIITIGIGVGIVAALIAGRVMSALLYDTAPYDVQVLCITSITLVVVAILACIVPAVRAVRVDPITALSAE